jgi:hypothetical protein
MDLEHQPHENPGSPERQHHLNRHLDQPATSATTDATHTQTNSTTYTNSLGPLCLQNLLTSSVTDFRSPHPSKPMPESLGQRRLPSIGGVAVTIIYLVHIEETPPDISSRLDPNHYFRRPYPHRRNSATIRKHRRVVRPAAPSNSNNSSSRFGYCHGWPCRTTHASSKRIRCQASEPPPSPKRIGVTRIGDGDFSMGVVGLFLTCVDQLAPASFCMTHYGNLG